MSCVGTARAKILLDSGIVPCFDTSTVNRAKLDRLGIGGEAQLKFNSSSPASSSSSALLLRSSSSIRKRHVEMAMELTTAAVSAPPSLILTSGASGRISALFSLRALRSLMMLINAFFLLVLLPFRGRKQSSEKLSDDEKQRGTVVRVPATIVHWKSTSSAAPPPPPVDHDVAARRALAKIRVRQDDDENSVRQYSIFATARGETLFTQTWTPVSVNIR